MTRIYIREGLLDPSVGRAELCHALNVAGFPFDDRTVAVLGACLQALRTRPRAEMDKGSYRPGKRSRDAATTFGVDLFDVYRVMGGADGIRSRRFYEFALQCASIIGIQMPPYANCEMRMYRATRA